VEKPVMHLPNTRDAVIDPRKLTGYLLSLSHPVEKAKAKFFRSLGFDETNLAEFEQAIREVAIRHEVAEQIATAFGIKYVIVGQLENPQNREMIICTVWIVEDETQPPRFVTAYPFLPTEETTK
jgi:hypothetical protein